MNTIVIISLAMLVFLMTAGIAALYFAVQEEKKLRNNLKEFETMINGAEGKKELDALKLGLLLLSNSFTHTWHKKEIFRLLTIIETKYKYVN